VTFFEKEEEEVIRGEGGLEHREAKKMRKKA